MELSKKVKMIREELGWSQAELAKKMGYSSRTSINKIENGRPCSQKIISRLANALGVSVAYLMGWQDEQPETPKASPGDLASHVKELREKKHYTLEEMAEELSIPIMTLKEYESGTRKIPYSIIKKMAKLYGVDLVMLYGMEFEAGQNEGELEATALRLEQAERWSKELGKVLFTPDELDELISFAKYLISKRSE